MLGVVGVCAGAHLTKCLDYFSSVSYEESGPGDLEYEEVEWTA